MMKRKGSMNVRDKIGFTYYLARKFFPHLCKHHGEDVRAIAHAADFLFPGPRVKLYEFSRIIQRRLYHTSRELGWRRVRSRGWTHDLYNDIDDELAIVDRGFDALYESDAFKALAADTLKDYREGKTEEGGWHK